ncbi:D-alanine--D-alanine ligase [Reinekea marina]|uniref:D-alanine--D-alanine ligase n=1 Tax=Reinekea marina TaxID=1310421 RepID=A0ABV7WTW5_9GAMM|nr:D-alanine--D-alanine ligase [Reinekea marina]MDN3648950.1 D-alanine--D-alanine ligase [Reinekea marina]
MSIVKNQPYVCDGMPPLQQGPKPTSFFEFWPTWAMYLPVLIQWLLLSIRHRSLTLPLIANPNLPLSGMVGVPKSELLAQAGPLLNAHILPWFTYTVSTHPISEQIDSIEAKLQARKLAYPFVCKPDIGCRGAGVKLIHSADQLSNCLSCYPAGANCMIQQLADYEPEAGVFYVREPGQTTGKIISLALKYSPYIVGDGQHTLAQLIDQDRRARELKHLYEKRHQDSWEKIIPKGEPYKLVFSASHCRGAVFKDAAQFITPELTLAIDSLMQDLPDFHYGRLDIKFKDSSSLQAGKTLQVVEINTASSESLHIWDANTSFSQAISSLLFQYKTLFRIGSLIRKQGIKTPTIGELVRRWRLEKELTLTYPETD